MLAVVKGIPERARFVEGAVSVSPSIIRVRSVRGPVLDKPVESIMPSPREIEKRKE